MQRRVRSTVVLNVLAALLLAPATAWSMRCGNYLINEGDPQEKVLRYCGEPTSKNSRYAIRPGTYPERGSGLSINDERVAGNDRYYAFGRSEVLVEEWTYNLGPRKLMRRIRFANGIVEEVKTLDYGYLEDD